MTTRDWVVAVLTAAAVTVGTVGAFLRSVPLGCGVLSAFLFAVAILLSFYPDDGEAESEAPE